MNDLSKSSRLAASDLRCAEHAIQKATRDAAQFLVTTLELNETHGLSPTFAQATVKATIGALSALAESQHQLGFRAHVAIEKAGRALGLTGTDWGAGDPKPAVVVEPEQSAA